MKKTDFNKIIVKGNAAILDPVTPKRKVNADYVLALTLRTPRPMKELERSIGNLTTLKMDTFDTASASFFAGRGNNVKIVLNQVTKGKTQIKVHVLKSAHDDLTAGVGHAVDYAVIVAMQDLGKNLDLSPETDIIMTNEYKKPVANETTTPVLQPAT